MGEKTYLLGANSQTKPPRHESEGGAGVDICIFPRGFPWHEPERAVLYHLVYHWTLSIHINHMFLLHTYLLGAYFSACVYSDNSVPVIVAIASLVTICDLVVLRSHSLILCGLSHVIIMVWPLAYAAHYLSLYVQTAYSMDRSNVCMLVAGPTVMLTSLLLQVAAHHYHEEFQAPMSLLHGLLAAPGLEWTSFLLRCYRFQHPVGISIHELKHHHSSELQQGGNTSAPASIMFGQFFPEAFKIRKILRREVLLSLYNFSSPLARSRWCERRPPRFLDYSLGRPILVCDEEGEYVEPPASIRTKDLIAVNDIAGKQPEDLLEESAIRDGWECAASMLAGTRGAFPSSNPDTAEKLQPLINGFSPLSGRGVFLDGTFAGVSVPAGTFLGLYLGTVVAEEDEEDWTHQKRATNLEDQNQAKKQQPEEHFMFALRDGAYAVSIDGEAGPSINALKFINHSCDPNCRMVECFIGGCWHVCVFAIREIEPGEELTHDYKLSTEDPDDPNLEIECLCGKNPFDSSDPSKCRGKLYQLHEW